MIDPGGLNGELLLDPFAQRPNAQRLGCIVAAEKAMDAELLGQMVGRVSRPHRLRNNRRQPRAASSQQATPGPVTTASRSI